VLITITGSLFLIFADSASYALSSSYAQRAISSSYGLSASYALSSSRSQQSSTSSYVALPNGGFVSNEEMDLIAGGQLLFVSPSQIQLTNNFGDAHTNLTPDGLYVDTTGGTAMKLWAETFKVILPWRTVDKFGIGTNNPQAKLHVQGNISASSVTASLFGTASNSQQANSASYAVSASYSSYAL